MSKFIRAEFYSMRKTKSVIIMFLLMCACGIMMIIFSSAFESGALEKSAITSASCVVDMMTSLIVGPFLAGCILCSEFQNKTIHNEIMYSKGREAVLYAKSVVYSIMIALMVLPYAIVTLIGFLSGNSYSVDYANSVDSAYLAILANKDHVECDARTIVKLLVLLVVIAFVYIARMSLCILLSYWIRKSVAVVGIGVAVEFILSLSGGLASTNDTINAIYQWTPFTSMRDMLSLNAGTADIIKPLISSIIFIVIVLLITKHLFARSEIK